MIAADLHNHTIASHGTASVSEMLGKALETELKFFGFSEHSPLPPGFSCNLYTGDLSRDFPIYVSEVTALRHFGRPKILLGLELDWLPSRRDWMKNLVGSGPFDYVLGSIHFLDGYSVGNIHNWGPEVSQKERFGRFEAYFCEMASMARSGLVHAASHPDFIKLRAFEDFHSWLEISQSKKWLESALAALAANGVAMEVSSAGLRQPFSEPYPALSILKMARRMGVKICFGSDAHEPAHIGVNFAELEDYAKKAGYSTCMVFIQGKPVEIDF